MIKGVLHGMLTIGSSAKTNSERNAVRTMNGLSGVKTEEIRKVRILAGLRDILRV